MEKIENAIKEAMVEYGAMAENWRLNIVEKTTFNHSDYVNVVVEIYKPRCKKPCTIWNLTVNAVRETIYFDKSTFVHLR